MNESRSSEYVQLTAPSLAVACIGVVLFPDVTRTFVLLQSSQTSGHTNTINTGCTRLENVVDHILAEFCVDRSSLFLVGSLVHSIGLVTYL